MHFQFLTEDQSAQVLIEKLMDIHQNKSPSFNHFIAELESRIQH